MSSIHRLYKSDSYAKRFLKYLEILQLSPAAFMFIASCLRGAHRCTGGSMATEVATWPRSDAIGPNLRSFFTIRRREV